MCFVSQMTSSHLLITQSLVSTAMCKVLQFSHFTVMSICSRHPGLHFSLPPTMLSPYWFFSGLWVRTAKGNTRTGEEGAGEKERQRKHSHMPWHNLTSIYVGHTFQQSLWFSFLLFLFASQIDWYSPHWCSYSLYSFSKLQLLTVMWSL